MGHLIYVNEQLTPAVFDEALDYNILSALDRANIDSEGDCRIGICGTCRVKLLRGQVRYPDQTPLGFMHEGEILPCCCVPITDIEIITY